VVTEEQIITLEPIYFDFDKSTIKAVSYPILDQVVKVMTDRPNMRVRVEGHTDSKGSDAYNQKLSQRRSEAVVKYLIGKGIDPSRLEAVGSARAGRLRRTRMSPARIIRPAGRRTAAPSSTSSSSSGGNPQFTGGSESSHPFLFRSLLSPLPLGEGEGEVQRLLPPSIERGCRARSAARIDCSRRARRSSPRLRRDPRGGRRAVRWSRAARREARSAPLPPVARQ